MARAAARPIARQIAAIRGELASRPKGLVAHVERVLAEALDLARRWDVDPERTELAVWGHDLFRAHSPEEQLRLARDCGIEISPTEALAPVLLHGPIAATVLRDRFAVTDVEALAAVRDHTSGAPEMSMLARVILVADKVERRKRDRDRAMREVRRAARHDLDLALLCWADWKWVEECRRGWSSDPRHFEARTAWVAAHHAEVGLPGRTEWEPDLTPDP